MTGNILIEGLRLSGRHGVLEQERIVGNVFELDIALQYHCLAAMTSDDIDSALNYAAVTDVVKAQMAIPSQLLENVVYRIKTALMSQFPQIIHGSITLYKIHPPISAQLRRVGFSFEW